jgi:hypothetical protein
LSQVKDTAEKAGFLVAIVVGLAGYQKLLLDVVGNRRSFWPAFRLMMMQRTRKEVDRQVSSQCRVADQGAA